jgi:hypothetical protein
LADLRNESPLRLTRGTRYVAWPEKESRQIINTRQIKEERIAAAKPPLPFVKKGQKILQWWRRKIRWVDSVARRSTWRARGSLCEGLVVLWRHGRALSGRLRSSVQGRSFCPTVYFHISRDFRFSRARKRRQSDKPRFFHLSLSIWPN